MLMMTGGGESGSMAPVMMTGDSLEYKNPATEPKWKDLPNNTTCCFREIPDYHLPIPTPQPIVANIRGKVYVLSGDHISRKPGCPEKPELSFQVLEFDPLSKSYHWKTLPLPHSYIADYNNFGERTYNMGVVGHRLFIFQPPMEGGELLHIFDAHTQSWESHEDGFDLLPPPAITLSGLLTSSGPYLKKTKRSSDIGQGKKDPLPAGFYPLGDCKVIDLLEEDEQDDDGHLSSSIFCVVYISRDRAQLALSVFRVSLLSPMVVVTPPTTDEAQYLSRQDKGEEEASDDESGGGDSLHVEILEKRYYALGDAYPNELSDAFFL